MKVDYKGYEIRKSGRKHICFKVYMNGQWQYLLGRNRSVEAAKCEIDASIENRPFTAEEHNIVYGKLAGR